VKYIGKLYLLTGPPSTTRNPLHGVHVTRWGILLE